MPKSILYAILKGNLLPWEEKFISTPRFNELSEKIDQEREHFEESMSLSEKKRFDKYNCLLVESGAEETASELTNVFLIGILLGMEIVEQKQSLLDEKENPDDR